MQAQMWFRVDTVWPRQASSAKPLHLVWLSILLFAALCWTSPTALAELIIPQQEPKLVGTGAVGAAFEGISVALSADGNTAIVGGHSDNGGAGAAWVFTRSAGVWTQQGPKLVGTGAIGNAIQGRSVSLSADGNTAIVGGDGDNGGAGAAWIFTRSGGVWTQQGNKLVGSGAVGNAGQGNAVAVSGDGNTIIIGGPNDNETDGATWTFTRSGGVWTQQGSKLVGTVPFQVLTTPANQGIAVSLSNDGNTAIVGGTGDPYFNQGRVWVFTRSGGVWTQQGATLGTGLTRVRSIALSADGNTAIVGGSGMCGVGCHTPGELLLYTRSNGLWAMRNLSLPFPYTGSDGPTVSLSGDGNTIIIGRANDNGGTGAAWVFTNTGGDVWTQLGSKLVGSDAVGNAGLGSSVSLSADGRTAILGGPYDNGFAGAAFVFAQAMRLACNVVPRLSDYNGDGKADLLLQRNDGTLVMYLMNGLTILGGQIVGNLGAEWNFMGSADFDGDGKADLLFRRGDGTLLMYLMNGFNILSGAIIGQVDSEWSTVGLGDFNGDGKTDILLRRADGTLSVVLINGFNVLGSQIIGQIGTEWTLAGIGDFNGDGKSDLIFRRADGTLAMFLISGFNILGGQIIGQVGTEWNLVGVADFNGDQKADLQLTRGDGAIAVYMMNGFNVTAGQIIGQVGTEWRLSGLGDLNADGRADMIFRRIDGTIVAFLINGFSISNSGTVGQIGTDWTNCFSGGIQ